ncbi:MAG: DNA recombination/repair protein RecA, partial [Solobacterium sp.]|nr:DNA recombination/repair protein RecA [Solobacterium sp.]
EGISHGDEVISLAVENDIIDKSGAWFSYKGEKIGQGFQAVRDYLKANPDFDADITAQVKDKLFGIEKKAEVAA